MLDIPCPSRNEAGYCVWQCPYFARREAMISHIRKLVQYCEEQWVAKAGTHRTHALRPYTYRPRKTAAEIEAHRLHRALCGNL